MGNKFGSEGGGVIWCHPGGSNCTAFAETKEADGSTGVVRFLHAEPGEPLFDPALQALAATMNNLVAAAERGELAAGRRKAPLQIGFLQTSHGYLPVWKRDVAASEKLADLVDTAQLKPLGSMPANEVAAYLRLEDGGDGEWRRGVSTGGTFDCTAAGGNCFVTVASRRNVLRSMASNYFPSVPPGSPVYDAALVELASGLNESVNAVQRSAFATLAGAMPTREIGLALEDNGIRVVWKTVART